MAASHAPTLQRDSLTSRQRGLVVARRRATALLVAIAVLFVAITATGAHGTLLGYVQAAAEASLVGGLADWFAVTALFRHPLGLPIPHTAVIVERKDQFAESLGQFVQENFLNGDVLAERMRSAGIVQRLGAWVNDEGNARRLAGQAADVLVGLASQVRDDDVNRELATELARALNSIEVAPLFGHGLRLLTADDRYEQLFNAFLAAIDRYVAEHYVELQERFAAESPTWVPDRVDRIVYDRLQTRLRRWIAAMLSDPQHEARAQFKQWITGLSDRLETSAEFRERGEQLKREVLNQTELRELSSVLWQEFKNTLRTQAGDPDSELRRRLAAAISAVGRRLTSDPDLEEGLERMAESAARTLAEQFHDELADLVTGTIQRWNSAEVSSQLELLLGRDLQFIRINGTVVGAGVGVILHAFAQAVS